jgi:sulfur-oxidizing protein SoxX
MGDWKRAQKVAQSGRGAMWSDKPGDAGGSCYNCHQLSAKEESYGTIGPSLLGFGKKRGNGADMQKYVYGKIYNAKAYNACSQMPRLGYSGTLTEQQMKDLTAYLLDPASPVNQ